MGPKTLTSNSHAEGRFDKQDFIYVAADDEYRCLAGSGQFGALLPLRTA
jgi:hypothetical protein